MFWISVSLHTFILVQFKTFSPTAQLLANDIKRCGIRACRTGLHTARSSLLILLSGSGRFPNWSKYKIPTPNESGWWDSEPGESWPWRRGLWLRAKLLLFAEKEMYRREWENTVHANVSITIKGTVAPDFVVSFLACMNK